MNQLELIVRAMRFAADVEREVFLVEAFGRYPVGLARVREVLRRVEDRIKVSHAVDDEQLRVQIQAVIGEMQAENPNSGMDWLSEVPVAMPDTCDSHRNSSEAESQAGPSQHPASSDSASLPTESFAASDESTGLVAGRYRLVRKIGEGGMGEVWSAKQSEPIKRQVALKLIKKGMDSKAVVKRFEQERQALAVMDHPNIARVFDGGMTEQGQPYFVMELVSGQPLNEYADREKLTTDERLQLFVLICHAVQHAHQKGIVHRDLKPANILVTTVDGKPVPKVIDFGVAKATGGGLTEESMNTQFGAIVGTLEYMAPEQAGSQGYDIDTRADIYSLGVVLYELLTGLRPIDRARLQHAGLAEMIRVIKEDEPSKPSTRLSTSDSLPAVAAVRRIEPKRLTALLRGELDWVVMKCLEKQRERRYETASGLARDIQRYLANEIVEARPPSRSYRLKKFVSKHRGQVISASLVLLALFFGCVAMTLGLLEAQRQTRRANLATKEKELALQKESLQAEKERLARQNAEAMTKNALEANNAMASSIQAELAPKPGMQELRIKLLRKAREGLSKILEQSGNLGTPDATIVSTYYQLGDLEWNLGDVAAAKGEFETGLEIAQRMATARPEDLATQRNLSDGYVKLGDVTGLLGDTERASDCFLRSLEVSRVLVAREPNNSESRRSLSIDLNKLGDIALRQGNPRRALEYYQESLGICSGLVATDKANIRFQRDLGAVHNRLGDAKVDLGNEEEALSHFQSAFQISQRLAELHPQDREVQRGLGINSGRVGRMLNKAAKHEEAMGYIIKARNALLPLVEADPQNAEVKRDLGGTYERMGDTALGLNDVEMALESYRKGLAISEQLANLVIGSTEAQRDLSINNEKLGDVLMASGRASEALRYYKTALEISDRLAIGDPNNAQSQSDLGYGYLKIGEVMSMQANFEEATKFQRRALDMRMALASKNPDNVGTMTEVYRSHFLVGVAMLSNGKFDDAFLEFRKAQVVLSGILEKGWYAEPGAKIESWTVEENREQLEDSIWLCENASKALSDVDFVMTQDPKRVPRLMRLRILGLMKSAGSEEAWDSAKRFANWIEEAKANPGEGHYQAGCMFALCVLQDRSNLEQCLLAGIECWKVAQKGGYFDREALRQWNQNSDLFAVRDHEEFSRFVASLTAGSRAR